MQINSRKILGKFLAIVASVASIISLVILIFNDTQKALIAFIFLIIVTAESESIGEVFKDMHAGAAFGTENFGFFLDTEGFTRNELSFAGRIFTAELLFSGKRIFTEFPCIRFT